MFNLELAMPSSGLIRSRRIVLYIIGTLAILLGLACLIGFVLTAVHWDLNSKLVDRCKKENQTMTFCYLRFLFADAMETHWSKFQMVSFLLTYASVFFHIVTETSRTNVTGLLKQTILQTVALVLGIGVSVPILFLLSFLHFYKSSDRTTKSPVSIDTLLLALVYVVCLIIVPTYLLFFYVASQTLMISILSIILLVSPVGFALISLPFRLCSEAMQRCWLINSHRLIMHCQIVLFILSTPLFFISLVSLIIHWSNDDLKTSFIRSSSDVNPISLIWSIDYLSLLISLILFIIVNEYLLFSETYPIETSKMKTILIWFAFAILFLCAPCLVFPLYIAWREYQYFALTY